MKTIAIIGAGQLGSRHLQGVHKSRHDLDIHVVDASRDSLATAESRYNQIQSVADHRVFFSDTIASLPAEIDLAIIASSSMPRYQILKGLLSRCRVKTLILEKFLFPRLSEYQAASELLARSSTEAFVNCPRRLYPSFSLIAERFDFSRPVVMRKSGREWGLCCNSIHYIDIFMKLTGEREFSVDTTGIFPEIEESKRPGYMELNGTLRIFTPRGDRLELVSEVFDCPSELTLDNGRDRVVVDEAGGTTECNGDVFETPVLFQSDLSGTVADTVLEGKNPGLTRYEESRRYHEILFKAIVDFVRRLPGAPESVKQDCDPLLPIT